MNASLSKRLRAAAWLLRTTPTPLSVFIPLLQQAANELERDAQYAARYRWLREQHWNDSPMCVVMRPRQAVKLGHFCPSQDQLDTAIDEAMAAGVPPSVESKPASPASVADLARQAGLEDIFGDGTRWQSDGVPSAGIEALTRFAELVAATTPETQPEKTQ